MNYLISKEWPDATLALQSEIDLRREKLSAMGFRPAFFDYATCTLYASRHSDGHPADDHVRDGLPDEVVVVRSCDRVIAVRATLIAGFERNGFFFTQASAWRAAQDWIGTP